MEIKKVPIDSLTVDPQNARKHGDKNLAAIKASLKKFGQVEPIVVNKRTKIIVGGNGRVEAMRALGFTEVNIVEVDLDNTQAAALAIALNRTGELGEWDMQNLGKLLHGLQEDGMDLLELGFEVSDFDAIVNDSFIPSLADENDDADSAEIKFCLNVTLDSEDKQQMLFQELRDRGFKVKA